MYEAKVRALGIRAAHHIIGSLDPLVQERKDARDKHTEHIIHHTAYIVLVLVRDEPKEVEQVYKLRFCHLMHKCMNQGGYVWQDGRTCGRHDPCERTTSCFTHNAEPIECRQGQKNLLRDRLELLNPCWFSRPVHVVIRESFGDGA